MVSRNDDDNDDDDNGGWGEEEEPIRGLLMHEQAARATSFSC